MFHKKYFLIDINQFLNFVYLFAIAITPTQIKKCCTKKSVFCKKQPLLARPRIFINSRVQITNLPVDFQKLLTCLGRCRGHYVQLLKMCKIYEDFSNYCSRGILIHLSHI